MGSCANEAGLSWAHHHEAEEDLRPYSEPCLEDREPGRVRKTEGRPAVPEGEDGLRGRPRKCRQELFEKAHLMGMLDSVLTYDQFLLYCRYAESLVAYFKYVLAERTSEHDIHVDQDQDNGRHRGQDRAAYRWRRLRCPPDRGDRFAGGARSSDARPRHSGQHAQGKAARAAGTRVPGFSPLRKLAGFEKEPSEIARLFGSSKKRSDASGEGVQQSRLDVQGRLP